MKGKYIVFEGIDGCGKTAQSTRLVSHLTNLGIPVIRTREPGSEQLNSLSEQGLTVRSFLLNPDMRCAPTTLELLLQTDRAQHTHEVLEALQDGVNVVSDRSFLSGLAYGHANGHSLDSIVPLADFGVDVLPDYVFFLDCSVPTAYARMNDGGGAKTREEVRGQQFMGKVRKNFMDLLFSNAGREHDILRQLDLVCDVHRISSERHDADEVGRIVDQLLGLVH